LHSSFRVQITFFQFDVYRCQCLKGFRFFSFRARCWSFFVLPFRSFLSHPFFSWSVFTARFPGIPAPFLSLLFVQILYFCRDRYHARACADSPLSGVIFVEVAFPLWFLVFWWRGFKSQVGTGLRLPFFYSYAPIPGQPLRLPSEAVPSVDTQPFFSTFSSPSPRSAPLFVQDQGRSVTSTFIGFPPPLFHDVGFPDTRFCAGQCIFSPV